MTVNVPVNTKASQLADEPDANWLRSATMQAFPAASALANAPWPEKPRDQWTQAANLVGLAPADLARQIAPQFDMEARTVGRPDQGMSRLVPESVAQRHQVVPMHVEDGEIVVATSVPANGAAARDIAFSSGLKPRFFLAPPDAVENARLMLYAQPLTSLHSSTAPVFDLDAQWSGAGNEADASVVRFARALVAQGIERGASDIHVHPFAGGAVARYRIDGQLQRVATISQPVLQSLIRMIKAQALMDPTNSLLPQDGQVGVTFKGRTYDLRISTLPSSGVEALVVRILDQTRTFNLNQTNFAPWAMNAMRRLSHAASGLLLITGPTGSGKTSTLYALLAELNQPSRRIITVEEPVEYHLPGLTQVEVDPRVGLTFAKALRSVLRQDPDILLIGEIRDAETAEIAIQSALTGHLVLATLHTQDAVRSVARLVELGVPAPMLADTLLAVVSQRLLRQLCESCKAPVAEPLSPTERRYVECTGRQPGARAGGCEACRFTGFRGRFPIVEIVENSSPMRARIREGRYDPESLLAEVPKGWNSIEQRAAAWVDSGQTTIDEAVDALGIRFWDRMAQAGGARADAAADLPDASMATRQERDASVAIIGTNAARARELADALAVIGRRAVTFADPEAAMSGFRTHRQLLYVVVDAVDASARGAITPATFQKVVAWSGLPVLTLVDAHVINDAANDEVARADGERIAYPIEQRALQAALSHLSAHASFG